MFSDWKCSVTENRIRWCLQVTYADTINWTVFTGDLCRYHGLDMVYKLDRDYRQYNVYTLDRDYRQGSKVRQW